ncbi:hypothetical protein BH23CHL7_BH23CHL7_23800 [soil metagenome]
MSAAGPRRRGGPKPRDVGTGVVCASFAPTGEWLSLAAVHPRHGFVELNGMLAFDERDRGDPGAVRRYRALMADERSAFLSIAAGAGSGVSVGLERPRRGSRRVDQQLHIRADAGAPLVLRLGFHGRLDRPALAMITEPPAPRRRHDSVANRLDADGHCLRVLAPEIESAVEIEIDVSGGESAGWRLEEGGAAALDVGWPAGVSEAGLRISCRLILGDGPDDAVNQRPARPAHRSAPGRVYVPAELVPALERVRRRALRYARECTVLRLAPARVAILTDHRLLPLSWTRDAYWQALLLLHHGENELVADHLRWLWLDCERPQHTWARSHHGDGRRADAIYQVEQQLYPLLELADYRRTTGSLPQLGASRADRREWSTLVQPVLHDLVERMSDDGLLATDENAADDPVGLPYVLANQLLAWHALARLDEVPELDGLEPSPAALAKRVARAVDRHFTVDGPAGRLWAYAVDGRGATLLLHDANDLPTALAPLWGYCRADNSRWRATIDFAFSTANPAFAAGRFGGLGSAHTPGVWSLGLAQEWIARSLAGSHEAAADALRRLIACAQSDWSLPEASDPDTGRCLARPWFAWPGAVVGALMRDSG